jgi:nitrate/nitrite transporter NarK
MQFLTWRWMLACFSLLGVIWVAAFCAWFRNHPQDHPGVNKAELALLPKPNEVMAGHVATPWRRMWNSPQVWLLCGQYFCQGIFFYFLVNWLPSYLREGRQLEAGDSALLAGIPMFLGGIGCLGGGLLLRGMTARLGASFSRRAIAITVLTAAAASILFVPPAQTAGVAIAAIGFAAFCNDLSMSTCWTTCVEIGGRFAGTLGGKMNMWGALGGFLSPMLIGWLLDLTDQDWNITFYLCAGIYALAAVLWVFLDPVTPLDKSDTGSTPQL